MTDLRNAIKRVSANMDDQRGVARHGIVQSVNPANGTVRVSWDEDGTLSGWIPVAQMGGGAGWSQVTLPQQGAQVFVVPDMGDISHGVVVGVVQSTAQPMGQITPYKATSPVPLVPGEPTFIHASGASLRLTAGGVIEMHGTLKVDGDILCSGNISDLDGVHGNLNLLRTDHNMHTHTDPQGGNVGLPSLVTP